jgi:thioesterase domain-containing protein/acyl carrier protein
MNGYGPTEATIVATAFEVSLDSPVDPASILPIGWPVAGAIAEVCSESGCLIEDGTVGELWVGGEGLARGYYGQPDLTSRSFVMNPRGRRYRTGDCVSRNMDGCLIFHGRSDRQVKIAGRRVALEEVEMLIRGIDGVSDAAVIVSEEDQISAWLELSTAVKLDEVAAEVKGRLPPAMRPRRYEVIASLPRTSSGKIEYKALCFSSPPPHENVSVVAHNPAAEKLAKCWCRALGSLPVTPEDDFFAKGGDSLAAITLLAEIEKAYKVALPLAELMLDPTPSGISRHLTTFMTKEDHRKSSALPSHSVIIEMRSGKDVPLVLIHGLGGHLLRLRPLAMCLPEGKACWGIQAPGIDDASKTPYTIEALAKLYLSELSPRLDGRMLEVCGMSFGGVIALEMARQHAAQGGSIGLVGLFDTELKYFLPSLKKRRGKKLKPWLKQFRRSLRRRIKKVYAIIRRSFNRLQRKADCLESPDEYRNFLRIRELSEAAMNNYHLKPQPVPTTIFASTERPPEFYEKLGIELKCGIQVVPVPGSHMTMLDPPHCETLVREILAQRTKI